MTISAKVAGTELQDGMNSRFGGAYFEAVLLSPPFILIIASNRWHSFATCCLRLSLETSVAEEIGAGVEDWSASCAADEENVDRRRGGEEVPASTNAGCEADFAQDSVLVFCKIGPDVESKEDSSCVS